MFDYASVKVPKNGILYKRPLPLFSSSFVLNVSPLVIPLQLRLPAITTTSRALDNLVVVKLDVDNAILGDGLDNHALEVDG